MIIQYMMGGLLGFLGGYVAILFAEDRWRLPSKGFFQNGEPGEKQRIILLIAGILTGLYGVWLHRAIDLTCIGHLLLCFGLLSATPLDIRQHEISSTLLVPFSVIGVVYNIFWLDIGILINSAFGALVGFAILGIPYLLRKGSVGVGDLFLLTICGLYTGFPEVVYLLIRALVFMAIWGIVKLVRKKANVNSEVPFTPFLLLATLI